MFKNMFEFLDAEYDVPTTDFEKNFFAAIRDFAFYDELDAACMKMKVAGLTVWWHPANIKRLWLTCFVRKD